MLDKIHAGYAFLTAAPLLLYGIIYLACTMRLETRSELILAFLMTIYVLMMALAFAWTL